LPIESHLTAEQLEARFKAQENEADKTVVWMIQYACACNDTPQALDLAHKLRTMKGLEAAILVANHLGRQLVAKRLQEIQDSRFPPQIEEQEPSAGGGEDYFYQDNEGGGGTGGGEDDYVGAQSHNENADVQAGQGGIYRAKSKSVTPSVGAPEQRVAVNPFAKASASPLGKRKSGYDIKDLKSLKSSPSPSKKPMLSVSPDAVAPIFPLSQSTTYPLTPNPPTPTAPGELHRGCQRAAPLHQEHLVIIV